MPVLPIGYKPAAYINFVGRHLSPVILAVSIIGETKTYEEGVMVA